MTNPTPIAPKTASTKVYALGPNIRVGAAAQPELHALYQGLEKAVRDLKKAAPADLQKQLVNDTVPAVLMLFEGLIAKAGGLENWTGILDDRIADVEEGSPLAISPEDGAIMVEGYDAMAAVLKSLDTSAMSDADREVVEDAKAKGAAGKALVLEYMADYEEGDDDDDDDDGEGDEGEDGQT